MGSNSGYKPGKYEAVGWNVLVINIICIVITFFILFDDLLKAILVLLLQIVVTAVTSMPFFYLEEVAKRVKSLELATYNHFYNSSALEKAKSSYPTTNDEEDFKSFSFDGYIQELAGEKKETEPVCEKKILNNKTWQCCCGKVNPVHTGSCGCGEKRPEYPTVMKKRMLEDRKWQCSCGRINQSYVGTCSCGVRRPK